MCSGYLPAAPEGYGKVILSGVSSRVGGGGRGGSPAHWSQVLSGAGVQDGVTPLSQTGRGIPSHPPPDRRLSDATA